MSEPNCKSCHFSSCSKGCDVYFKELSATQQKLEESQRENAELTRKLAEQQAHTEKMREVLLKAFQKITCYSGLEVCGDIEDVINNIGTSEELTKLLAEAKSKAVPEGCVVERGFEYDSSTGLHTPTLTIFFPAVDACCSDAWEERDSFAAMLASSPQPETAKCESCGGNDEDAPCAYPSERKHGCLRDARMSQPETDRGSNE